MTKANESFSAFLDGEASELDIQRMLKALDESPNALHEWHDLSKVQAGLQDDVIVDTALEFSGEQSLNETPASKGKGFRLLQGGIAAAVAVVVVTTANFAMNTETEAEVATVTVEEPSNVVAVQQQFEAQQRLDEYLREHAEQASHTNGHVVAPTEVEWVKEAQ